VNEIVDKAGEVLPEVVYVAMNHLEAEVVRGLLESEGIPALLQYESVGLIYGLTIDGMGETKILVPEPMAERARALLGEESLDGQAPILGTQEPGEEPEPDGPD
jgi:hypothetical protein